MTGLGLSSTTYGGYKRKEAGKPPLQGVMQGNGMGPIIWLAISVLLISTMHSLGFANTFWSAMTQATISLMGFIFVDDCDLIIAPDDENTTAAAYLPQFQKAVDAWEGLLRATGGGIKPAKSFWYLIDHKWDSKSRTWKYASSEDVPGEVTIRVPGQETRTVLEQFAFPDLAQAR